MALVVVGFIKLLLMTGGKIIFARLMSLVRRRVNLRGIGLILKCGQVLTWRYLAWSLILFTVAWFLNTCLIRWIRSRTSTNEWHPAPSCASSSLTSSTRCSLKWRGATITVR